MAKSEYLQREDAAKKQLGAKGVSKRVKQVPRAARLSVKELTGVNISRKGVSVDPLAAAAFIPFGKSLSVAAKALKPASKNISFAAKEASEKTLNKMYGSVKFKDNPMRLTNDYIRSSKAYNTSQSTNYSVPLGLGIIGGAAVLGSSAAKDNARKARINKASTKTRKGQTRGR